MKRSYLKPAAYAFYFLSSYIVLLVLLFPSKELKTCLEKELSGADPRLSVSIDGIRPALPLGIKAEKLRFEVRDGPGTEAFTVENLSVGVLPGRLLRGEYALGFGFRIFGGHLNGDLLWGARGISGPVRADLRLEKINLGGASALMPGLDGVMEGALFYRKGQGSVLDGSGEAEVFVSGCRIPFSRPGSNIDALQMDQVEAAVSLAHRKAELNRFTATGKDFDGSLEGFVRLEDALDESRLALRGSLSFAGKDVRKNSGIATVREQARGDLSFRLGGTLANPEIRLTP